MGVSVEACRALHAKFPDPPIVRQLAALVKRSGVTGQNRPGRVCRFGRWPACRLRRLGWRSERLGALAASIGGPGGPFGALAPTWRVLAVVCYGAPVWTKTVTGLSDSPRT